MNCCVQILRLTEWSRCFHQYTASSAHLITTCLYENLFKPATDFICYQRILNQNQTWNFLGKTLGCYCMKNQSTLVLIRYKQAQRPDVCTLSHWEVVGSIPTCGWLHLNAWHSTNNEYLILTRDCSRGKSSSVHLLISYKCWLRQNRNACFDTHTHNASFAMMITRSRDVLGSDLCLLLSSRSAAVATLCRVSLDATTRCTTVSTSGTCLASMNLTMPSLHCQRETHS